MQLKLSQDEFNIFIMLYLKAVLYEEIDYKAGIKQLVADIPDAMLLLEERETKIREEKWTISNELEFDDSLKVLAPSIDMKNVIEFDKFLEILNARNMDDILRQRYFRQNPRMRLYLRRVIDQFKSDQKIEIKVII